MKEQFTRKDYDDLKDTLKGFEMADKKYDFMAFYGKSWAVKILVKIAYFFDRFYR